MKISVNVAESDLGAGETLVDDPPQKSCATYLKPTVLAGGLLSTRPLLIDP
jgi:hypothetical protein